MDTIIQKAAKGNRAALTQLYESNKREVYFLCRSLLRDGTDAIPAAKWALKSSLLAVNIGEVQTEDAFFAYAVKQAASYCKKSTGKKDARAFKLPPQKNFRISHVNDHYIDPEADMAKNYVNCLPAAQRFALVLRLIGAMDEKQIARTIGLDIASVTLLREAEPENLGKVYRALQAKGISCVAPTTELLAMAFDDALSHTNIPDELEKYMSDYINSVATPVEDAAKSKRKIYYIAAAAIAVVAVILIAVLASGGSNDNTVDEDDTAGTVTSADADTELDEVLDKVTTDSVLDIDSSNEDATDEDSETNVVENETAALDASMIYYADIEIQDYGTITVQLDQESAPITVANFVSLAESGFYDGLTFHRIIEGFMMQGGDPEGNGTGGSEQNIVGEFSANGYDNALSHTRGAISMARSNDYDSASSQFFIVHEDSSASLDGQYAVFGYVTEGMDVVDAVCEAAEPTDNNGTIETGDQPIIISITIRTESVS